MTCAIFAGREQSRGECEVLAAPVCYGRARRISLAHKAPSEPNEAPSERRIGEADEAVMVRIPTQAGQGFRFHSGHRSDLMPATIPR